MKFWTVFWDFSDFVGVSYGFPIPNLRIKLKNDSDMKMNFQVAVVFI
ncbi:MAG: hypothetical protein ACTTJG_01875 [Treponema sp.]